MTAMFIELENEKVTCKWDEDEYCWHIKFRGAHIIVYVNVVIHVKAPIGVEKRHIQTVALDEWNFLNSLEYAKYVHS